MVFEEGIKIEDEGFKILWTFLEFPNLLIAAGFVVKDADDDVLVDGLTAASSILQDLFCLC